MPCAKASPIFMLFDFTEISKSSQVVVQQVALMFGFPLSPNPKIQTIKR